MLNRFLPHYALAQERGPFQKERQTAWEALQRIGLPDRHHPLFAHFPLHTLYQHPFPVMTSQEVSQEDYLTAFLPESRGARVVLVDGKLRLDLCDLSALPSTIKFCSFQEAAQDYGSVLHEQLLKASSFEHNPFALLNLATYSDGLFVFIPAQLHISSPIQCLNITTKASLSCARIHIYASAHSQAEWIFSQLEISKASCINMSIDITLEQAASCKLMRTLSSWQLDSLQIQLKKNSSLVSLQAQRGSEISHTDTQIILEQEGASATVQGMNILSQSGHAHNYVIMKHLAPHTNSLQLFKTILADTTRAYFEGKIWVAPEAQKTEAYQINRLLLLNDHAQGYSKPSLEIFADDVKASHGATICQLDQATLFYLQARGIDPLQAKRLLIQGFCQDLLGQIPYPTVAQLMTDTIHALC